MGVLTTLPVLCMGLLAPVANQVARRVGSAVSVGLGVATILIGRRAARPRGWRGPVAVRRDLRRRGGDRPRRDPAARHRQGGVPRPPRGPGHRADDAVDDGGRGGRRGGRRPRGDCARRVGPLAARVGPAGSARAGRVGARRAGRPPTHPARRRAGRRHPRPAVGERHGLAPRGLPHLPVVAVLLRARVALPHVRVARLERPRRRPAHGRLHRGPASPGSWHPTLLDHVPDARVLLVVAGLFGASGEVGVWLAPDAMPWLWALLLGAGQGAAFALGSSSSCGTRRRRGTAPGSPRWRSSSATPLPPPGPPSPGSSRTRRAASRRSGDCSRSSCCPSSSCRCACARTCRGSGHPARGRGDRWDADQPGRDVRLTRRVDPLVRGRGHAGREQRQVAGVRGVPRATLSRRTFIVVPGDRRMPFVPLSDRMFRTISFPWFLGRAPTPRWHWP